MNDDLDRFVNEIFKDGGTRIVGAEGFVERMGKCTLTRSHLPDEVLEVFFGEQMLSPGDISTMSAVQLQNVFAPGKEMIGPMVDKWMGKQTQVGDGSFTKTVKSSKNHLKPEIADIVRKRLSQAIEFLFPVNATMICDSILAASKWVQGMLVAAGYAFGVGEMTGGSAVNVDISNAVGLVYTKVANRYFTNPDLNFNRVAELNSSDFLFFPKISSAISTRIPQNLTKAIVKEDVKNYKASATNIRRVSATERLFEDFFDAAFAVTPGRINRVQLRETVAAEINDINKKLIGLQAPALEELRTELVSDYMQKSDATLKHLKHIIMLLNPPEKDDILRMLTGF